ncbi:MAG: GAF domain-containing protein [Chloroflexi bacterium]|nr:GAF domain-containing protein [Chloroflexota bacterium]
MGLTQVWHRLLNRIENISIRTRLLVLMLLFGLAVIINILALFFLARSVSSSLQVIESARVRQLAAVETHEKLRNAEAALYRYHLEGAAGFATQFEDQITLFGASVATYQSLAATDEERRWANELAQTRQNAANLGKDLIRLHDKQTSDLEIMLDTETQLTGLLLSQVLPLRGTDPDFQRVVNGMNENAQGMLLAVTAYLTLPDDNTRAQFTATTIQFQQYATQYRAMANRATEADGANRIDAQFARLQNIGSQLISDRDQQQSLYARFFAEMFQAGQRVIVGQIQPHEAQQLAEAQQNLWAAVGTAILVSLVVPITMTVIAAFIATRLARGMNQNILALLRGADRVAAGHLEQPVTVNTTDELKRLAEAFNNMMTDLATRELRLKARLAELETLRQVSLHITSTLDLDQVLNTIATSVLGLVEASNVYIFTRDDAARALQLVASAGRHGSSATTPPRPDSLVAVVASTGQPHVVHGALSEPLFNSGDTQSWSAPSTAAFPMKLSEQILGVLHIVLDARRTFTSEDVRILSLLADQAAVALGNARLYTSLAEREERVRTLMQKMAQIQDEERRLIGLDLHDGLTQLVISANMHLQTLNSMIAQVVDAPARHELEESRALIQSAIAEARRVITELRPTAVEDWGLAEGLRRYVLDVCVEEGWRAETQINLDGIELSPAVQTAIFRIAQEALANARKHSHTDTIKLDLQSDANNLFLQVQDSGCGFDLAALTNETERLGLISMRERAKMLGGACEITSQLGHGTRISVRIPLAAFQRSVNEQ